MKTYEFTKGKQVFLLRSPTLRKRLKLPKGWSFKAKRLDRDLVIETNGVANIVPDNLESMYQGCVDGVCTFDPWN